MPKYGRKSEEQLATCCVELQAVFKFLIRFYDHAIIDGYRDEAKQNAAYSDRKSRVKFPNGKHNLKPSFAVDAVPYDSQTKKALWDTNNCIFFAGMVILVGIMFGYRIKWGGNWDMDRDLLTDQDFQDLVHFEFVGVI